MKVDLAALDLERWHINPAPEGRVMVVPHKIMWKWSADEIDLRSLLCRDDGTVVSAGFPKFLNYGEQAWSDALTDEAQATVYTHKMDGSLIIRSVIDGKVNLRTRGCAVLAEHLHEPVHRLIRDTCPGLLKTDLGALPCFSTLFEYCAPDNQIVIRYDKPHLTGLAFVRHDGARLRLMPYTPYCPWGIAPTEHVDLPDDVRNTVGVWDDREGVVAWRPLPGGGYHLTKFKSVWYMRLHGLRSQATPRYVREYCWLHDVQTLDDLKAALLGDGFDWETVEFMEPTFRTVHRERNEVLTMCACAAADLAEHDLANADRKTRAMAAKAVAGKDKQLLTYVMNLAMDERAKANDARDAMELQMGLQAFKAFKKEHNQ